MSSPYLAIVTRRNVLAFGLLQKLNFVKLDKQKHFTFNSGKHD